ncbi:outer membrane protein [Polynucleobacter sp. UB-Raua-W9]|uniref:outer membrane protein n=1 Tax=Polynucleobacter sp. UB-Raua-W9 TaxID=1819736 RepID=UPI001BFCF2DE|nr:outer membrane beta-barrel protein [Polynucleobacter sp. UB-Raua-W9]QWD73173.1 hypothetical protein AOC07_04235 [Polynucleobacter sp. UB-Raua-W9]
MKSKLVLAISATLFAGTLMAQSTFQGFYGQVGAGYEKNNLGSTNLSFNSTPLNSPAASSNSGQINFGLGYNHAINSSWLLGLGAEYSAISSKFNGGDVTGCGGSCQTYFGYKVSNRYSIFLTPGYALDKESVIYAKAGYTSEKVQSTNWQNGNYDADYGFVTSATVGGYILGLGYKKIITGGLYGFGEANYYGYSSPNLGGKYPNGTFSNYTPSTTAYNLLVGLGYKF